MATCKTKTEVVSYTLELTEAEAEALSIVVGRVEGYASDTKRGLIDNISGALYAARVPRYKYDKEPTGSVKFT